MRKSINSSSCVCVSMSMRRRIPTKSAEEHAGGNNRDEHDEELILKLAASLRSRRSESLEVNGIGEELWTECVELARDHLIKREKLKRRGLLKMFCVLCNNGLKRVVILLLVLSFIGLFFYLCKPASFFLQRKLHSRLLFTFTTPYYLFMCACQVDKRLSITLPGRIDK